MATQGADRARRRMRPRSTRRSASCWSRAAGSTRSGLGRAQRAREASHDRLHVLLPKLGLVSEREVAEALAQLLDLPLASEADYPGSAAARRSGQRQFPERGAHRAARRHRRGPGGGDGGSARPLHDRRDAAVRRQAGAALGRRAGRHRGRARAPARAQPARPARRIQQVDDQGELGAEDDVQRLRDLASEAPVVRIVNRLISTGGRAARLGHPHRAVRAGPARALPHRRRAARGRGAARCSCAPRSSRASRSWRASTSPSAACPRMAASSSRCAARTSTCASPRCRPCTARRWCCASSIAAASRSTSLARLRRRCARRLSRGARPARTASSWSPARPAAARPPRSTPR